MSNFLATSIYSNIPEELMFDIPECTNLSYFFNSNPINTNKVIFKNSNNVTNWSRCFYTGNNNSNEENQKKIREIELDMSSCENCSNFFNSSTSNYSNCPYLQRIIFTGSFGGNSTTSSLTLDLSKLESMSKGSYIDMFTSLGENTNQNTRIFKINKNIYNKMSKDELAIATNKGYTISYQGVKK